MSDSPIIFWPESKEQLDSRKIKEHSSVSRRAKGGEMHLRGGYQRFNDVQSMTKRREMTYEHCHCGALKGAEKVTRSS